MTTKMTNRFLVLIFANLMLLGCKESTVPYEGPPKDHIITVERARELYKTYSERRVPIIQAYEDSISPNEPKKFQPTRAVEFDLETIKQYIAYIEHEANEANVEINTLRFYLSNYPNAAQFPNGDTVKYPRKNSIFVVPTMDYKGVNVGFSIEEVDGKYTAVPINKQATMQSNNEDKNQSNGSGQLNEAGFFMSNSTTVQGGTKSLILNDGSTMPPPPIDDFSHTN